MYRRIFIILVACQALISCKNNTSATQKDNSWSVVYKNAYSTQDYVTAVVALNHLIITDSANRPAYYDSLSVYYIKKLRNYNAAKKTVDKGLALNPNNFQLLEYKSIFLSAENKIEESRKLLDKAYKLSGQNKHLYMYATSYAAERNFEEYNRIANGILYNPNTKPEKIEVSVDDNVSQFIDLKALCYLDKAKIATNGNMVVKYIDSALQIEPTYQEALYFKEKIMGGGGQQQQQ
jgi:tetratricopeptide (TPR) repeat protein